MSALTYTKSLECLCSVPFEITMEGSGVIEASYTTKTGFSADIIAEGSINGEKGGSETVPPTMTDLPYIIKLVVFENIDDYIVSSEHITVIPVSECDPKSLVADDPDSYVIYIQQ